MKSSSSSLCTLTRSADHGVLGCACRCARWSAGCNQLDTSAHYDEDSRVCTRACALLLLVAACTTTIIGCVALWLLAPSYVDQNWTRVDACTVNRTSVLPFSARDCGGQRRAGYSYADHMTPGACAAATADWPSQINGAVAAVSVVMAPGSPAQFAVACCVHPALGALDGYDPAKFLGGDYAWDLCTCGPNASVPSPPVHGAVVGAGRTARRSQGAVELPRWSGRAGRATYNAPPRTVCSRSTDCTLFFQFGHADSTACSVQTDTRHELYPAFAILGSRNRPYADRNRLSRIWHAKVFLLFTVLPLLALACVLQWKGTMRVCWCRRHPAAAAPPRVSAAAAASSQTRSPSFASQSTTFV